MPCRVEETWAAFACVWGRHLRLQASFALASFVNFVTKNLISRSCLFLHTLWLWIRRIHHLLLYPFFRPVFFGTSRSTSPKKRTLRSLPIFAESLPLVPSGRYVSEYNSHIPIILLIYHAYPTLIDDGACLAAWHHGRTLWSAPVEHEMGHRCSRALCCGTQREGQTWFATKPERHTDWTRKMSFSGGVKFSAVISAAHRWFTINQMLADGEIDALFSACALPIVVRYPISWPIDIISQHTAIEFRHIR